MVLFKRKFKKAKAAISAICCLSLVCSGCSVGKDSKDVIADDEQSTVRFAWWGNDVRHSYTMDGVEEFEYLNPDINVNCTYGIWDGYSKRQNVFMMSKEVPDVMQINYAWISEYSADGEGFYDLNQLSDIIDLSNYTQAELEYGMSNGKLNAIPIAFNAQTMYYNKDTFDKYGLEIPKTWDDLFDAAKVMSKDGIYPIGMGEKQIFMIAVAYLEQLTGRPVCDANGRLSLSKTDIGIMLDFYKRLIDEKVMIPIEKYDINTFLTGKSAGTIGWVSDVSNYCDDLIQQGANVVVGPYPCRKGAKRLGWYVKPATMYAISKTTENPQAAARLVNYLLNSEEMAMYQGTEKGIPISDNAYNVLQNNNMISGIANDANTLIQDNQDELSIMQPIMENNSVYMSFKTEADYYLYDKQSKDEVVNNIYRDFGLEK